MRTLAETFWAWWVLGLGLIGLEVIVAPGSFTLWLGLAALVTGGAVWLGVGWPAMLYVFAGSAILSLLLGWRVYRGRVEEAGDTHLNNRGGALVGRVFPLSEAIRNGYGVIRVDDSVWRVSGPELPAGASVRVTGVDGATLRVESEA